MKTTKILNIKKLKYKGDVYNLELESSSKEDDLFWIEQNTGIITHNCYPKDLSALVSYSKDVIGYNPDLLEEVIKSNERIGEIRKKQRENNE